MPVKVVHTYRVLQHFRTPVYRRLAAHPEIDLLVLHGGDFPGTKTVNARNPSGFAHRQLPTWRLISRVTEEREITLPLWPTLPWHLARERPDVIFAEGGSNLVNNFVIHAWARLTRTPLVYWTLGEVEHPGSLAWYQRWFRRVVATMDRRADAVVGYSSRALAYFDRIGIPRERQFRAVNVVDTERVEAERARLGDRVDELRARLGLGGRRVLLFVGALAPYKRVEDLIAVYARLRERHPDWRLLVVGGGGHRPVLERFAAEHGADDAIFTGEVLEGVAPYFEIGDLFVLPGLGGLALSEAITHGLAVVATRADGTERDLVEEGRNGHVLPPGDRDRLEACLDRLMADPASLAAMGTHSRRLVREHYNIAATLESLVAALRFAHGGVREPPSGEPGGPDVSARAGGRTP